MHDDVAPTPACLGAMVKEKIETRIFMRAELKLFFLNKAQNKNLALYVYSSL